METTPTLLMIGIYHGTIFHQKCNNYCGVLGSFEGKKAVFKAWCKRFSDSFEGLYSNQKKDLATLLGTCTCVATFYRMFHYLYISC